MTDHSLLRRVAAETREARFALYETIREVAAELLAEDPEREVVAERHARHYAGVGDLLAERATAHADHAAVAALARELDNLVAAHAHATAVGDTQLALTLALALDPVLATRGHSRLRLRVLDATPGLALEGPEAFAPAYLARVQAHRELGAFEAARADLARGRSLAERRDDRAAIGLADLRLGELVEVGGDTREARELYARALVALEHARGSLASVRRADAHAQLGHVLRRDGELADAEGHIARAVELYRAVGHREGLGAMAYEAGARAARSPSTPPRASSRPRSAPPISSCTGSSQAARTASRSAPRRSSSKAEPQPDNLSAREVEVLVRSGIGPADRSRPCSGIQHTHPPPGMDGPAGPSTLGAREWTDRSMIAVEPPRGRGATRERTRRYATEEQRSPRGWIDREGD